MENKGKAKKTSSAGPSCVSVLICDNCEYYQDDSPSACRHEAAPKFPFLTVIFLAPEEAAAALKSRRAKTPNWCPLL